MIDVNTYFEFIKVCITHLNLVLWNKLTHINDISCVLKMTLKEMYF